jgi:prophage maintenance system killer protein
MSWTYRVIVRKCPQTQEEIFAIHEVYYDENDAPGSCTVNPAAPIGASLGELKEVLQMYSTALEKPVLRYGDFQGDPLRNRGDEEKGILDVVNKYSRSWSLLLQYDEDRLPLPKELHPAKLPPAYARVRKAIDLMKTELVRRGEAGSLFGQEREHLLKGLLGNIDQTFGGQDLYPSVEEKAAHLLYFVIKDHPFSDGNKRIGSFLFLLFLRENDLLEQAGINDNALVALALLVAESDPRQKELMTRLIVNLLG